MSFPQLSQIRLYTDLASVMDDKLTRINMKNGKCFGVEYGGGKLVVSCQTAVSALFGFHNWWFCVFNKDGVLTQVIEKDKHGNSFDMREGYFSYCPYRDQILFLASIMEKQNSFKSPGHQSWNTSAFLILKIIKCLR